MLYLSVNFSWIVLTAAVIFSRLSLTNQSITQQLEQQSFPVTTIVSAEFNVLYNDLVVNRTSEILFIYNYTESKNKTTAVRISVYADSADQNFPVMFVAMQQEGILSWSVPLTISEGFSYWEVSRTLCPLDKKHREHTDMNQLIYLTISTMARTNQSFGIVSRLLVDFELAHGVPQSFNVSVVRPKYFMYLFPEGVETVLLRVTSPSDICMTVSVQPIGCPVFDDEANVKFKGKHQTMSTQAAMFLEKNDYSDAGGFYVVFITNANDQSCMGYLELSKIVPSGGRYKRTKMVKVEIDETISSSQYYKATFAAVGVLLAFYVIAFIIGIVFAGCGLHKGLDDLTNEEIGEGNSFYNRDLTQSYGAASDSAGPTRELGPVQPLVRSTSSSSGTSLDESGIDFLRDVDSEKDVFRTKMLLYVSDLAKKKDTKLSKLYGLYLWNLLTIAIFYGLPVAQLVITYQRMMTETGNQDLCYYNFACAHPLKTYLNSFNNVFSNVGYVLLGFLFIFIVARRATLHGRVVCKHLELERRHGIPQHFGLYYAMGLALVMEGIMSGCYHVCPNYSNFQFDTSFMYIIACLCMLKIYQNRHPDIYAKAHVVYFAMAVIIFIAVLGVVYGSDSLWIFYAIFHIMLTFILTAQIYYMGRWRIDRYVFKRLFHVVVSDCRGCSWPVYLNRFVMLLIGNAINWAFALYGAVMRPSDFASFLLAVFIGNLLLYCIFYFIMKLLSGERLSWLIGLVILTSMVTWSGSLYFFFQELTSWQKTPAGSRAGNKACILMEFYDAHDVWHFLSAFSLFFSFMILLLLDDDLSQTRRDKIRVF